MTLHVSPSLKCLPRSPARPSGACLRHGNWKFRVALAVPVKQMGTFLPVTVQLPQALVLVPCLFTQGRETPGSPGHGVPHLPHPRLKGSDKEWRRTCLHAPAVDSLLPFLRGALPNLQKAFGTVPAEVHISKEWCRLQIPNYWDNGPKECPQESPAGEGKGCNPRASQGLLHGANWKQNGFLIHDSPAF